MSKPSSAEPEGRCHLLIRNALVIDGSGAPGYRADVAVESDRIAAVGGRADVTIPFAHVTDRLGFMVRRFCSANTPSPPRS